MHIAQAMDGIHLHVQMNPRFRISRRAGRTGLKFCEWLETDYLSVLHTQSKSGVHLQVCTFKPLFHISGMAGRITLKFGVCLETYWLCILHKGYGASVRAHVRTPFPYLGKSWTHYAEIWCVVLVMEQLAMHFTLAASGIPCTRSFVRLFFVSRDPLGAS